jgi:hypothetical protein
MYEYGDLPKNLNLGQKYSPAMEVKTEEEASKYLEKCIKHTQMYSDKPLTYDEAKRIEMSNIGYYSGYYSYEQAERVRNLYHTVHPVFG